jgi:hypothetical protein
MSTSAVGFGYVRGRINDKEIVVGAEQEGKDIRLSYAVNGMAVSAGKVVKAIQEQQSS